MLVEAYIVWARRIWAVLVAAVLLFAAAYFDWFGPAASKWAQDIVRLSSGIYGEHKDFFDFVVGKLGLVGAASYALYRWLIRTDFVLAKMLAKFMARRDTRLAQARATLLTNVVPYSARSVTNPGQILIGPLDRALKGHGYPKSDDASRQTTRVLDVLREQLTTVRTQLSSIELQKSTAHIVQGLIHTAKADTWRSQTTNDADPLTMAETEFSEALKTRSDDVEALELRALLRIRRGHPDAAVTDLHLMQQAARRLNDQLAEARAWRHLSELKRRGGTDAAVKKARELVENGIKVLNTLAERRTLTEPERIELAQSHLLAAEVFLRLKRPQLLDQSIERCGIALKGLGGVDANTLKNRLEHLHNEIAATKNDQQADADDAEKALVSRPKSSTKFNEAATASQ